MNKLLTIIFMAATGLAACSDRRPGAESAAAANTTGLPAVISADYTDVDPVCGMVRDSTWTDYTLYKSDTVWFCAAPEMKAFIANPEKYLVAKPADSSQNHQQ